MRALACRNVEADGGFFKAGRFPTRCHVVENTRTFPEKSVVASRLPIVRAMAPPSPPSRQERRKAERAAAKRAPAQSRGTKTAAALANVKPLGDWTTQSEDPMQMFKALGYHALQQKVDAAGVY